MGAAAQRTGEFAAYRDDYNEINAAQLDRSLGAFSTPRGLQGGARMTGTFGNLTLGTGLGVARMTMRANALASDDTRRDMSLTVSDFFPEVEAGIGRGPRLIGGLLIRSSRLVAVRSDAAGTSTDGAVGQCVASAGQFYEARCTLGTFEANSYPYFAGVSWDVPLGRHLSPRLVVTRVFSGQAIGSSQQTGVVGYADDDLRGTYVNPQGPDSDAFFPTRIKPGATPRNASGSLSGWRVALTLQLHSGERLE